MTKKGLGTTFAVLAACFFLFSCRKGASGSSADASGNGRNGSSASGESEDSFISPGTFFTLDYTAYEPEKEIPAVKVNVASPSVSGMETESIVPGLRKISAYATKYHTKQPSDETLNRNAPEKADAGAVKVSDKPFTVCDWGPKGELPAEVHNPSFYVLFSEPVVPVAALGSQTSSSPYITITPALKGVFRWNGTSLLSFDASEPCDPLQSYTMTVSPSVLSLSGKKIEGDCVFRTTAAALAVKWFMPGYKKGIRVDPEDVPPDSAHDMRVQFNYPVKAADIAALSSAGEDGKAVRFTVEQELVDTVSYLFPDTFPYNTQVTVSVRQPDGRAGTADISFHTLRPFHYSDCEQDDTYGKYTNPVRLVFSHPLDKNTVYGAVSTVPKMPVTKNNLEVQDGTLVVYGLPVTFKSTYTIILSGTIADIYGRKLGKKEEVQITVPGAASSVRFLNSGAKMLEAQFPHRLVFEHQNVLGGSVYSVQKTYTPLADVGYHDSYDIEEDNNRIMIPTTPENKRLFEVVDLDPYLKNGKGFIRFDASVNLPRKPTEWNSSTSYKITNTTTVQVTNLGVTMRYGVNKAAVLVTNLSDGKPVKDANVYIYQGDEQSGEAVMADHTTVHGKTDADGLAVIVIPESDVRELFASYQNSINVLVEKDGDMAMFSPESHSPWRSGVHETGDIIGAYKSYSRIFMFSDRGLYKPGETLSFRGIDRNQEFGSFIPYKGSYTVTLQDDGWGETEVYGRAEGYTSESGGFYGSFSIPENIEPGMYVLKYKRDGASSSVYVNVAFFERLKFQTTVAMPVTPVVAGDKIQAELSASYLAGGALASAGYDSSWFREPWYFSPDSPKLKNYRFGPADISENRMQVRSDSGALDSGGKAHLSCETTGNSIKGAPYRYRVSADVTDVSNQLVSAAAAVVVHPASYYIGVSKPEGVSVFPRKGEKLTFSYILALPDGTAVTEQKNAGKVAALLAGPDAKLSVKLTREEWNLVQQQGVSYDIYSRYEKTEVTESEQQVSLQASAKISVTAQQPGYHTLHLSATDATGRAVITEYSFFATGSGSVSWYQEDAASLRLTPDQSQYNPGDTAHILMESALPEGNYLITVEREGIFTEEVKHFNGNIQVIDIPVARNYVPVVYVSVSSYSVRSGEPHNEYGTADLDKPKGYYGAATLFVNPRVKTFSVKIDSPKQAYRPGEEAEVTLTATKGGKPLADAELTLMAVDRGVLDLIDYHVPDPVKFFYDADNFPLRVYGGDSRAMLMDPVTYEVKNLSGGDSESADDKLQERKDFNPTAVFEPVLKTDKDGKVSCRFKLPDTLTTYRITAFGVDGELLALQESEIAVQNPVNVQQVLPRRMRERDTSELGVLLTNLDSSEHQITVSLEMKVPESIAAENGVQPLPGEAFVDGENTHTIKIPSGANATVYFDAAAKKAGIVTAVFTVKSDVVNERIVCPLTIERPYIYETFTTTGTIDEAEKSAQEMIALPGFADNNQGSVSVTLDATRLGLLGNAVQYVFDYPYGCLEQQSARVLPLVVFGNYIDVFGLHSNVSDVHGCVVSYFSDWKKSQFGNGAFGYWPGSQYPNQYVSTRIAHIWALALQRGYTKQELAIDGGKLADYLENEAGDIKIDNYTRAYMYYVLALMGRNVSEVKLNALYASKEPDISILAFTGLASIAENKGTTELARRCAAKIRTYMRPTTRGVDISDPHASSWYYTFYDDASEQLALSLQLFVQLDSKDDMNTRILYALLQKQRSGYWQSTATTSRVLDAIYTLIKCCNVDATDLEAFAGIDGKEIASGTFKGVAAKPVTVTLPFSSPGLASLKKDKELPLDFTKRGKGALYYTATLRYAIPEEMQIPRDEGLGVTMSLYDNTTGEEIKAAEGSSVVELESGKTYRVKMNLSSTYDRSFLALRVPVPSGAEILDATFVTSPDVASNASGSGSYSDDYDEDYYGYWYGGNHWMSNQAIYDNEIQFFWDDFGKGKTTAEFKFRAVRKGVFPVPSATAECMYEPEVFGRTGGILYTIK